MNSKGSTSEEGISSTVSSVLEYEVFLSFRGPDTRDGFSDHLYTRLSDAGIRVYRDDEQLRVGEEIGPDLLEGIIRSKIAIPIFSKGYVASRWCLKELAQIVECKRSTGLKVMPIFYDVTPREVRSQAREYRNAFESHVKRYDEKTIGEWREALREVGNLKGWDIQTNKNRQEGQLVKEVTRVVLRELKKAYLVVTHRLVGVEHHVEKILSMINTETCGVRIFGIYGMGGIGKTTLAKVIYNQLLPCFESYSFLADIRETSRLKGMVYLQKKLISDVLGKESIDITYDDEGIGIVGKRFSNKKVLILLDDVDKTSQLQGLIRRREWFGFGSRIIITTRNKSILDSFKVDWSYELTCLDPCQALQLFSRHAFRNDKPPEEFATLSQKTVEKTGGLPLALEVFGSLLCGKSKKTWDFTWKKLEKIPHEEVGGKLRVSIEALDEQQRQIFLDIACFFIGADERIVIHFWNESEYFPEEAIEVLQQMSLIKIQKDHSLWMHDQLRDVGREIVRQEHTEPEKRSRLWNKEEATNLFTRSMVDENVQGIYLDLRQSQYCFTNEEFAKLPNLRLLHVNSVRVSKVERFATERSYPCDKRSSKVVSNYSVHKNPTVFPKLRWLSWHHFPHMYKTRNFSLKNLAILDLSWSKIKISWKGWSYIKMAKNLKVLNLTGCKRLIKTPDFTSHPLLERLILEKCSRLVEIDMSISMLKHLVFINLKHCRRLHRLPNKLSCMESLEEVIIDHTSILEIPNWPGLKSLRVLSARYCFLLNKFIPLNYTTPISKLSLDYTNITIIPDSIGKLVNLVNLSLTYCKGIRALPESIGDLGSLSELDLSFSGVVKLPRTIGNLKNSKALSVSGTPIRKLPSVIGMMQNLQTFHAKCCFDLQNLPKLHQSLVSLKVSHARIPRIPDLSGLINLKSLKLWLSNGSTLDHFESGTSTMWWIGRLNNLNKLSLSLAHITTLNSDVGALSQLTELKLFSCSKLQSIPKLPPGLTSLEVNRCSSFGTSLDLSDLRKLCRLVIKRTPMSKLEGLCGCGSLQKLHIEGCDFSEIGGLEILENLKRLGIYHCGKLQRLPYLSNLKQLKDLKIWFCPNLVVIPGRLEWLNEFDIRDCESLEKIPDLANCNSMRSFSIQNCGKLHKSSSQLSPDTSIQVLLV